MAARQRQIRINMAAMYKQAASIDVRHIDEYRELVTRTIESEMRSLKSRAEDADELYLDYLADDAWVLREMQALSNELAVVALYRVVEVRTKQILAGRLDQRTVGGCYRVSNLKQVLSKVGVELSDIPHFRWIDELRCLNNDIKHSKKVGNKLSKFPNWTHGRALGDLGPHYIRLSPRVPKYIFRFAQKLGVNRRRSARQ